MDIAKGSLTPSRPLEIRSRPRPSIKVVGGSTVIAHTGDGFMLKESKPATPASDGT